MWAVLTIVAEVIHEDNLLDEVLWTPIQHAAEEKEVWLVVIR